MLNKVCKIVKSNIVCTLKLPPSKLGSIVKYDVTYWTIMGGVMVVPRCLKTKQNKKNQARPKQF
jgi:hypothetical protein